MDLSQKLRNKRLKLEHKFRQKVKEDTQKYFDKHILSKFKAELQRMLEVLSLDSIKFRWAYDNYNRRESEIEIIKNDWLRKKPFILVGDINERCSSFQLPKGYILPKGATEFIVFIEDYHQLRLSETSKDILRNIIDKYEISLDEFTITSKKESYE